MKYRDAVIDDELAYSRIRANHAEAEVNEIMAAPLPCVPSPEAALQPEYKSNPMPIDLANELKGHLPATRSSTPNTTLPK